MKLFRLFLTLGTFCPAIAAEAKPNILLLYADDLGYGDTVIYFPPYCWIEDDKVVKAPDTMMDTKKWRPIKEGEWECRPGPMVTGWDPYQNIPETTRRGVEYIKSHKDSDKPFFLYFAYPSPHAPIIPNDEFSGKSKAGPYGDFVHETDLTQKHNLAAEDPERVAELQALLKKIRQQGHSAPRLAK